MAQTGYTPILLYSSTTAAQAPAAGNLINSTFGSELAINITDGKLFYKDNANAVQVIAWKTTPTTAGGTGLTSYTAGDLPYYATGTTLSKLAIGSNGQILTSTGTAPQWATLSGVAVTTFSAGTTGFTPSVATSGAVTLAGTLVTTNGGTGLSSYTAGDLTYYASGTTLTKLAIGASTTILTSSGTAPQWSAASGVAVGTATNLAGGLAGSVPYQSGAGATTFLGIGAANTVLTSSGTAPQWSTGLNNVTIGATTATTGKFTTLEATTSARVGTAGTVVGMFSVTGGRSLFGPNNETYAIALGYNQSRLNSGQTYYLGATDATAPALVFSNSAGTERFRVADNGDVSVVSGNVIMSTSGKGIDFSATAGTGTSELLADYEEGTWTPVDGSGASLSFTSASGVYTKVGRQVTVFFTLVYPATANANAARIGGLPFTAANSNNGFNSGAFNVNNSGQVVQPSIIANDVLFAALLTATGTSATNAQLTGATLRGGFSYFV